MDRNREENSDWWESTEPEVDFNELNRVNYINRLNQSMNTNIIYETEKLSEVYNKLNDQTQEKLTKYTQSTANTSLNEENPFSKFERLKQEIDLIEKDLKFYSENPDVFNQKFNYSVKAAFSELNKLKIVSDFIKEKENFVIMKSIYTKHGIKNTDKAKESNILSLLNSQIIDKTSSRLISNIKTINDMSKAKPESSDNIQYELYLTPDTSKVKLFSQIVEIQKEIDDLKDKLGGYDIKVKKSSLSEAIKNIKNNLRLYDKEFQKELTTKFNRLEAKLGEISNGKDDFYRDVQKNKIDELYKLVSSAKQIEDLIFKTLTRVDSLKQNHEEAAFIFVKVNELNDATEKINLLLDDDYEILTKLKDSIVSNNKLIRNNLSFIKERMSKLKAKCKK